MIPNKTQVLVIGGGPAGATASTLLAKQGVEVTLLERDSFPRYHIGESLIPETYWVLDRLGMLPKLRKMPFVKKYSVQFVSADGRESAPFYFLDNNAHECSQTWQVVRSEFDHAMLTNARENGVRVFEKTRVLDVLFDDGVAKRATLLDFNGVKSTIDFDVVVDATGQSAILQNKLKLRVWDPVLNKGAIWTYWKGARRDHGVDEGATIVIQTPNKRGWFWYIPLHEDRVSVGIVGPFEHLFKGRVSHEETYQEEVALCPAVSERLKLANRETGYFATRDYSYRTTQGAGDGWVTIGDAFGFLDPLYSSGVLLALKSAELAADHIVSALHANECTAARLGAWCPNFNLGIDRMRRLVCEFYDGFNFGTFVRKYPELRGKMTDLLIGRLFSNDVDVVWSPMESLYSTGKEVPIGWNQGNEAESAVSKGNELIKPPGRLP